MRFEHDGLTVFWSTADAPAPEGTVAPPPNGRAFVITVGVQPPSGHNSVQLIYRINGHAPATVDAKLTHQDLVHKVQYFDAPLPPLHEGDHVEYVAVAHAPGRRVPAGSQLVSSFAVRAAGARPVPSPSAAPASASAPSATPPRNGNGAARTNDPHTHLVEGYVVFEHDAPADGLTIVAYHRGFGGTATRLGQTHTDHHGYYALTYAPVEPSVHLELRTVDGNGHEVTLHDVQHAAKNHEVLNLVAPSTLRRPLSEYERLTAAVAKEIGSLDRLAQARDDADHSDTALLSKSTGWDAEHIAHLTAAVRMSARSGIPADVLYALFRHHLPTDDQEFARVPLDVVRTALTQAAQEHLITLDAGRAADVERAFSAFALHTHRGTKSPEAVSTYHELLAHSGLTPEEQARFWQLYVEQGIDPDGLWDKLAAHGIPRHKIESLKLQGKLSYLTANNAPLVASLQRQIHSVDDLARLVEHDLHERAQWSARIRALAGHDEHALARSIPASYQQASVGDRLDAYADDIAHRVATSFPTHVVAHKVAKNEISVSDEHQDHVAAVLKKAAQTGFELGRTPVGAFLAQHRESLTKGMKPDAAQAAIGGLQRLSRLHQITPSDASLQALNQTGLGSAHEITQMSHAAFLARYAHQFPSPQEADLVYRKAQQVTSSSLALVSMVRAVATTPATPVLSAPGMQQVAKDALAAQFPTLEGLFGSADYCECKECRSVLSPAAYFVDLLSFLDRTPAQWQGFTADWRKNHENAPYPFRNSNEYKDAQARQPVPPIEQTPYDVLTSRRPDLPNLPLTCENTNVVMPYIDIVNEVLEYFVAYNSLSSQSGHDTGNASSPELLAEPANVMPAAYDKLAQTKYPLTSPFDLWHETLRRLFEHAGTSLASHIETFRPVDDRAARADALIETLGLTPQELFLFTDSATLGKWWELYGYGNANDALAALSSAKTLARRLDVTYKELVQLITIRTVNPQFQTLATLHRLGIELNEVVRYKQAGGGGAKPTASRARFAGFDVGAFIDQTWQSGGFQRALILADQAASTNFDQTILRFADASPIDAVALLRLNLFVRLAKRIGWSFDELDVALRATLPKSSLPLTLDNIGPAFKTALIRIAQIAALDSRLDIGRDSRIKLSTLFSDLPTFGDHPLYEQFFLNRASDDFDPVFDDAFGNYLAQPGVLLKDHLPAVQAALALKAKNVEAILGSLGLSLDDVPLSLGLVSALYRHGLLAKALGLSVANLIVLKRLSGVDPFAAFAPEPLASTDNLPLSPTLRFLDIVDAVRASGFDPADLDYLFAHRADPVGKYREDASAAQKLVRTLASGLTAIVKDHSYPSVEHDFTDTMVQKELALVLPPAAVTTFMGLWTGNGRTEAQGAVAAKDALDAAAFAGTPDIVVTYDPVLEAQRLSVKGAVVDPLKAALLAAHPQPLFATLVAKLEAKQRELYDNYLSAFLPLADFQAIVAAPVEGASDSDVQKLTEERRRRLAARLLPYVHAQLIHQFVAQTMAGELGGAPALITRLISDVALLEDPQQPSTPLASALGAPAIAGVDVSFSFDGGGAAKTASATLPVVDTKGARPAGANGVRFEGYFEVPASGPYRLTAELDGKDGKAEFEIDAREGLLLPTAAGALSDAIDLKAGTLYRFRFSVTGSSGDARLWIQGESLPRTTFSAVSRFPRSVVDRIGRARTLLTKVLLYSTQLNLSERELTWFATHAADFDGFRLGTLPVRTDEGTNERANKLFAQFLRIASYVALRKDAAGDTDDLIGVLESAAGNQGFAKACARLADLTRRDPTVVQKSAAALKLTADDLRRETGVGRLWRALASIESLSVAPDTAARWATVPADQKLADEVRNAIRARYSREDWVTVAPNIFDKLRQAKRDALVAYILHTRGFSSREEMFEYFLIDPGMEPIVQTSRIRLAISAVQAFVQRSFLSLEPAVNPAALDEAHWTWLGEKQLRDANLRIFLNPENWLDEEFRDDKTELFRELEGSLLQGEVSHDLAEDAYFTYIRRLEEIARLEMVSAWHQPAREPNEQETLHVVARTNTLPHKYYYRTRTNHTWTPWESIPVQIDGDHVVVAVWRNRVNVFWITFIEQPRSDAPDDSAGSHQIDTSRPVTLPKAPPYREIVPQLSWCERVAGQWSTPAASGFGDQAVWVSAKEYSPQQTAIHADVIDDAGAEVALINLHFPKAYDRAAQQKLLAVAKQQAAADERNKPAAHQETKGRVVVAPTGTRHPAPPVHVPVSPPKLAPPAPTRVDLAFKVLNRNLAPQLEGGEHPPTIEYATTGARIGGYQGNGALTAQSGQAATSMPAHVALAPNGAAHFALNAPVRFNPPLAHINPPPHAGGGVVIAPPPPRGPGGVVVAAPPPRASGEAVLARTGPFSLVPAGQPRSGNRSDFFFYSDRAHVFFVERQAATPTLTTWTHWAPPLPPVHSSPPVRPIAARPVAAAKITPHESARFQLKR
jgi:hypothetical protein